MGLILSLILGSTGFSQTNILADLNECNAYLEKSSKLMCSKSNYLTVFGNHYCRQFILHENNFTAYGKIILASIRKCLITHIENNQNLTCENAEEYAMRDHIQCYDESNYCSLSYYDKLQLLYIVWPEIHNPKFQSTMQIIEGNCIN